MLGRPARRGAGSASPSRAGPSGRAAALQSSGSSLSPSRMQAILRGPVPRRRQYQHLPSPDEGRGAEMADTYNGRKRIRKQFGSIGEVAEMPNLIEVQKSSYDDFLMVKEPPGGRGDQGLQSVFKSVFPISDFSGRATLDFERYEFEPPKYDVDECQQRDMTYRGAAQGEAAPDRVRRERGDRRQVRQGREGAGRLHGRHALHDAQRHLRHQRHRARHRQPDAPLARRVLRSRPRAHARHRASCCSPPASFPIAAPGSTSSSTPRTSSTCASTGAASCR